MKSVTGQRLKIIVKLVESEIVANAYERGGYNWAAVSMAEWAERTGWSEKTVRNYLDRPPFYSEKAFINDVRVKIVRVLSPGEEARKTPQRVANEMRKAWANRRIDHAAIAAAAEAGTPWKIDDLIEDGKVKVSKTEHGCLVGLAELWPYGHQMAILKWVLEDWTGFIVLAKMAAAAAQDAETDDPDLPVQDTKFFNHPTLPVVRKFWKAAVELYVAKVQGSAEGKKFGILAA
ncbi:MAG: hypothetical protein ABSA66_18910 [Roseiarcus sp.]